MQRNNCSAEQTKDKILEAAVEVFYIKGVTKTTLEDIAKHADLTRGAIYWHFKNKKDIFRKLHEDLYKTMMQIVFENMDHDNPIESLQDSCIKCIKDLSTNNRKKKTLTIFFCKCDYSNDMEDILEIQKDKKSENIKYFTTFFEQHKSKIKSDILPYSASLSLSCYLSGIVNEYLRNNLFDLSTQAEPLIKLFFQSIKK